MSNRLNKRVEATLEEGLVETPWAVRASAVLLLSQVLLFLLLAGLNFWETAVTTWEELGDSLRAGEAQLYFVLGLLLLTALTVWASLHFFRRHHRGWLYAMLTQCFCLLLGLVAYFSSRSISSQLMLLSGIFMTIYLHNPETKAAFPVRYGSEEPE
jgi:hypothetical protein